MSKKKYYAVKLGHKKGIFNSWAECKLQVEGYSGAVYKSFSLKEDAVNFLGSTKKNNIQKKELKTIISYIDGSYNKNIKLFSCGVLIIYNNKMIELKASSTDSNIAEMRNVAGELMGVEVLIKWVEKNIVEDVKLIIHYDYEGIERWANKEWKANKIGTKAYKIMIDNFRSKNNSIEFVKVKAHSGDKNNEIADRLAGEAGIDFTYLVSYKLDISGKVDSTKLIDKKEISSITRKNNSPKFDELFKKTMNDSINNISKFTITTSNFLLNEKLIIKFIKACWKYEGNKISDIKSIVIKLDTDNSVLKWEINVEKEMLFFSYYY